MPAPQPVSAASALVLTSKLTSRPASFGIDRLSWRPRAALLLSICLLLLLASAEPGHAADGGIRGAGLSLIWGLPFIGILLCIATGPLFFAHVWEHHYDKIVLALAACIVIPLYATHDIAPVTHTLTHAMLLEYMPFILLLLALFTVAGGIYIEGNLHDSVFTNTVLLAIGTVLASFVGTTGASMILIRPLIRANDARHFNAHVIVFFIFLVSNIGGALTPLGDPPLFIGFLKGVDFFWTTQHLIGETAMVAGILLALFCAIDIYFHRRDARRMPKPDPTPDAPIRIHGKINFLLIAIIIVAILMSANWKSGIAIHIAGNAIALENLTRDAIMLMVVIASLLWTKASDRQANGFSWGPMKEVAILFAGIFVCIAPVTAMLNAGMTGPFAPLIQLVTHPDGTANNAAYFWMTGFLSSFLDNAPTYLVFFELAGGDPQTLMTRGAATLAAISAGAVFMGANTYIGNAPNFMVYAIARYQGVKMPGFFGYMAWSACILLPCFMLVTFVFFRG